MTLDVLIPTYNRSALLRRTLDSLVAADQPQSMPFVVTVCDNNSTDDTAAVVAAYSGAVRRSVALCLRTSPWSLVSAERCNRGEQRRLVAMIDDDEEVDRSWLCCIERAFGDPGTDFIGGTVRAAVDQLTAAVASARLRRRDWPRRLRQRHPGVRTGIRRNAHGGNAVIRRRVLTRVGPYRTDLGRSATRLMSCEDEDMFKRLLAAGARGFYRPDLIVHHYVAPERVAKRYFRRWCFWRGVSLGILDRQQPQDVAYLLGVPAVPYGRAVRAAAEIAVGIVRGRRAGPPV